MYVMTTRFLTRILVFSLILFGLIKILNLPQWYLDTNVFTTYPNNSVKIQGNKIVSTNQIIDVLRPVKLKSEPIYMLNTSEIEKNNLKTCSNQKCLYKKICISLKFEFQGAKLGIFHFYLPKCVVLPAKMRIIVDEKAPMLSICTVPKAPPVAIFTEDNTIIGKDFLPLNYSKNIYSVITYDDFYKWNPNHIKYLVYLIRFLEGYSHQRVVYLDIRNPDNVFVQLTGYKLRIGELNQTVFKRTERIESILSEAVKIKNKIEYIDLRWENYPSIKLRNKDQNPPPNAKALKKTDE